MKIALTIRDEHLSYFDAWRTIPYLANLKSKLKLSDAHLDLKAGVIFCESNQSLKQLKKRISTISSYNYDYDFISVEKVNL